MIHKKTLTEPINQFSLLFGVFLFLSWNRLRWLRLVALGVSSFTSLVFADDIIFKEKIDRYFRPTTFALSPDPVEDVTELVYDPTALTFFTKVFNLKDRDGKILFRAYEDVFNRKSVIQLFKVGGAGEPERFIAAIKERFNYDTGNREFGAYDENRTKVADGSHSQNSIVFSSLDGPLIEAKNRTNSRSVYSWIISAVTEEIKIPPLLIASLLAFERHRGYRRNQLIAGGVVVGALVAAATRHHWLPYLKKYLIGMRAGAPGTHEKVTGDKRFTPPPSRRLFSPHPGPKTAPKTPLPFSLNETRSPSRPNRNPITPSITGSPTLPPLMELILDGVATPPSQAQNPPAPPALRIGDSLQVPTERSAHLELPSLVERSARIEPPVPDIVRPAGTERSARIEPPAPDIVRLAGVERSARIEPPAPDIVRPAGVERSARILPNPVDRLESKLGDEASAVYSFLFEVDNFANRRQEQMALERNLNLDVDLDLD